ncbi:MAG: putative zinc-binding metallopeptidase [Pseudomonadales bacterium]
MIRPGRRADYRWADYDDDALLKLRLSGLRLRLRDSLVWPEVQRLFDELDRRGFRFRPHVWLAEDWFSPDAAPGIAIPFFVAHPRLRRLERTIMGEVEGGSSIWRLRILRHEAGHAIDTAYGLRRRADWRSVFGPGLSRYPRDYWPQPSSNRHVLHIGHWYAQSHPTEDFAETFAVWMQPKARWRRDYADWPALEKLEFVDSLMDEVRDAPPLCRNRAVIESLAQSDLTLGQYYKQKLRRRWDADARYDRWIEGVFVSRRERPRAVRASRFLREIEPQLQRLLTRRARMHPYLVNHAIRDLILRVRALDLMLPASRRDVKRRVAGLVEAILLDILKRDRENYAL